jgi:hypothetical protein
MPYLVAIGRNTIIQEIAELLGCSEGLIPSHKGITQLGGGAYRRDLTTCPENPVRDPIFFLSELAASADIRGSIMI